MQILPPAKPERTSTGSWIRLPNRINPLLLQGKRSNAVLISSEDWEAIQETLFLLSIPGMRESIKAGMEEPIEAGSKELDW